MYNFWHSLDFPVSAGAKGVSSVYCSSRESLPHCQQRKYMQIEKTSYRCEDVHSQCNQNQNQKHCTKIHNTIQYNDFAHQNYFIFLFYQFARLFPINKVLRVNPDLMIHDLKISNNKCTFQSFRFQLNNSLNLCLQENKNLTDLQPLNNSVRNQCRSKANVFVCAKLKWKTVLLLLLLFVEVWYAADL